MSRTRRAEGRPAPRPLSRKTHRHLHAPRRVDVLRVRSHVRAERVHDEDLRPQVLLAHQRIERLGDVVHVARHHVADLPAPPPASSSRSLSWSRAPLLASAPAAFRVRVWEVMSQGWAQSPGAAARCSDRPLPCARRLADRCAVTTVRSDRRAKRGEAGAPSNSDPRGAPTHAPGLSQQPLASPGRL